MDLTFTSEIPVRLIDVNGDDLKVARAAWVSTKGERAEDEDNKERVAGLINFLMRDRHGSPFEQASMTFLVKAPLFVWREHHRHRIASYNEQSSRYMQLAPEFYIPDRDRNLVQTGKAATYTFSPGTDAQYTCLADAIKAVCKYSYESYSDLIKFGIAKEVARMVLPVNIFSSCYVTMNLRALMNFLSLRTKRDNSYFPSNPQREIEIVAEQYEMLFTLHFPLVWAAFQKNGRVAP